jgi:transcriptional regulator MraZ
MFFGLHERQLDDKGRVALPASFRDDLGDRCVLVFGDSRCIEVHAADAFEARAAELRDDVKRGVATMARQRGLAHSATPVAVDRQGRITVDERLRAFARIPPSSKVIVTGNIDRVELWNDGVYREIAERSSAEMAAVL